MANEKYYKYKPINNLTDLERLFEIIKNKKIYLPRFNELNDPFESYAYRVALQTCGSSVQANLLRRSSSADVYFEKYGILSLTKDCKNQTMWAMYANQFSGVCLCFENLKNVKKVKYLSSYEIRSLPILDEITYTEKASKNSLMIKNKKWMYEKEYRILSKKNFYNLNENNISFIILGHKLSKPISLVIELFCEKYNINVYRTYIDYINNKIRIVDYDYNPEFDGTEFNKKREIKL